MKGKDDLLSWLGKTKTAARRVVSAYLKTMPLDVRLQDPKLQALCEFHPNRRFPPEVVFVSFDCEICF
jgi:hypothetical protein